KSLASGSRDVFAPRESQSLNVFTPSEPPAQRVERGPLAASVASGCRLGQQNFRRVRRRLELAGVTEIARPAAGAPLDERLHAGGFAGKGLIRFEPGHSQGRPG